MMKWLHFGLMSMVFLNLAACQTTQTEPTESEMLNTPHRDIETIKSVQIDAAGEHVLVRTNKSDFEYDLPPNHLNEAIATYGLPTTVSISGAKVEPAGQARAELTVEYGHFIYASRREPTEQERAGLPALGFTPEKGFFDIPLQPVALQWQAELSGSRKPPGSIDGYATQDLFYATKDIWTENEDRIQTNVVYDPEGVKRREAEEYQRKLDAMGNESGPSLGARVLDHVLWFFLIVGEKFRSSSD